MASEGKETEKNYFTYLKNKIVEEKTLSNDKIDLPLFQIEGVGMIGERLIDEAEKYFRRTPRQYKYKWLVFDKDDLSSNDFHRLIEMAESRGFRVAWSNECFELWLVLHFEFLNTGVTRDQYITKLDKHLQDRGLATGYKKSDHAVFDFTFELTEVTLKNAENLNKQQGTEGNHTPSS
ncbi:RloB family protein [Marinilactibacillus psychrotolerans]|uniref:RloB family protein n=1 Tax=Marinilactibacillus psychrotolerans TaxID=191770 RepID=A0ABW8UR55_9LACT